MPGRCGKRGGVASGGLEERSPGRQWRVMVVPPGEVGLARRRPRSLRLVGGCSLCGLSGNTSVSYQDMKPRSLSQALEFSSEPAFFVEQLFKS